MLDAYYDPDGSLADDPYRRLAAGVIASACKLARVGDLDSVSWLLGEQDTTILEMMAENVGLQLDQVRKWALDLDLGKSPPHWLDSWNRSGS